MPTNPLAHLIEQYDDLRYALLQAQTFDPHHFGFPPVYYRIMESDQVRTGAFRAAFDQLDLAGKVVCEAGVGRLALTWFYLPFVRRAYLIESNPQLFDFLTEQIARSPWAHKVELRFADARTVQLPEPIDLLVGEMMSIFCANEYQVQVFRHLRQFLAPGGHLLPQRITNVAQLAQADFSAGHRHYPLNFSRHLPTILSPQGLVNTIDLATVVADEVPFSLPLTPWLSGPVNAVLLRSLVQLQEGVNFTGTDSLMPPTVCQLATPCHVRADTPYLLTGTFTYGTDLGQARFLLQQA